MAKKSLHLLPLIVGLTTLAGCGTGELSDLNNYVKEVKARPGGRIEPLPEIKPYDRFLYRDADLRDPFKPVIKASVAGTMTNQLMPNMNRDKEALEDFPLDTLRMVGSLDKGKEKWAIVKSSDGLIYRIKVGNHVGKNFGEVKAITDDRVMITEIIPDGFGGWIEREAQLVISE